MLQAVGGGEASGEGKPESREENQVCIGGSTIWISPVTKGTIEVKNSFAALDEEGSGQDASEIPDPPPGLGGPFHAHMAERRKKKKMVRVQRWAKPKGGIIGGFDGCDCNREDCQVFVGSVDDEGKEGAAAADLGLTFQVTDVQKPLLSVKRLAEKGNKVCFGPDSGDNYIFNSKSGARIPLKENGKGSYLMMAKFRGGRDAAITIDSGAEESVCPKVWGSQFGIDSGVKKIDFRNASGGGISHFGERKSLSTVMIKLFEGGAE